MIHSIDEINKSYCIPENQIVFGTKEYQNNLSNEYFNNNIKDPKIYLTKAINNIFNSALSSVYSNGGKDLLLSKDNYRINVINGLDVKQVFFTPEKDKLVVKIRSGLIILDDLLLNIPEDTDLILDVSGKDINNDVFVNKKYDKVIIGVEYFNIKDQPLKLSLFLYDSETTELYSDLYDSNENDENKTVDFIATNDIVINDESDNTDEEPNTNDNSDDPVDNSDESENDDMGDPVDNTNDNSDESENDDMGDPVDNSDEESNTNDNSDDPVDNFDEEPNTNDNSDEESNTNDNSDDPVDESDTDENDSNENNNSNTNNNINPIWTENTYIHKSLDLEITENYITFNYTRYNENITINNLQYSSQSHNYCESKYIDILTKTFGDYYLLDLPYVPPMENMIHQITKIFLSNRIYG